MLPLLNRNCLKTNKAEFFIDILCKLHYDKVHVTWEERRDLVQWEMILKMERINLSSTQTLLGSNINGACTYRTFQHSVLEQIFSEVHLWNGFCGALHLKWSCNLWVDSTKKLAEFSSFLNILVVKVLTKWLEKL